MMDEKAYRSALEACTRKAHENHNYITEKEYKSFFEQLEMNEKQDTLTRNYLQNIKIRFGTFEGQDTEEVVLSEKDGKYLKFYMDDLEVLCDYTEEETAEITKKAMEDDADAKKKLISIHLKDVVDIAKLYVYQGLPLEDLIGEGNIGLMMGVDTLGCIENAEEVEGHLGKMIMDAMDSAIAADTDTKEEMERVIERITDIGIKAKELSEDLRRDVTIEELSRETGIEKADIDEAMRLTGNNIEGLVRPDEKVI